jgi:D-lyxose ketol-isomerase
MRVDMKRSEINKAISNAEETLKKCHFFLPCFAYWAMNDWKRNEGQIREIISTGLGWDVTDFGTGEFDSTGATIFTIRNGNEYAKSGTPYAEKIIVLTEGQAIPLHYHYKKTEDIINRGNGILSIKLYRSKEDGSLSEDPVEVKCDGILRKIPAGQEFEITAGNSITLTAGLYHTFRAKENSGILLCGEVSSINDDNTDNRFYDGNPKFAEIIEDEEPCHPLCNEYPGL